MGQYYRIAMKDGDVICANEREWGEAWGKRQKEFSKLLEHAFISNGLMDSVSKFIHNHPVRIMWCGDYAGTDEVHGITGGEIEYKGVWGEKSSPEVKWITFPDGTGFSYAGKFLVNRTKSLFVSFDRVLVNGFSEWEGLYIHPLPILTAVGNGRGNGDYCGDNAELAGTWAWDLVEVADSAPEGFKEVYTDFCEKDGDK